MSNWAKEVAKNMGSLIYEEGLKQGRLATIKEFEKYRSPVKLIFNNDVKRDNWTQEALNNLIKTIVKSVNDDWQRKIKKLGAGE